jgi:hypothetical protein
MGRAVAELRLREVGLARTEVELAAARLGTARAGLEFGRFKGRMACAVARVCRSDVGMLCAAAAIT